MPFAERNLTAVSDGNWLLSERPVVAIASRDREVREGLSEVTASLEELGYLPSQSGEANLIFLPFDSFEDVKPALVEQGLGPTAYGSVIQTFGAFPDANCITVPARTTGQLFGASKVVLAFRMSTVDPVECLVPAIAMYQGLRLAYAVYLQVDQTEETRSIDIAYISIFNDCHKLSSSLDTLRTCIFERIK